jgi:hypothetical protein
MSKPMPRHAKMFGFAALLALAAQVDAADWQLQPAQTGHGPTLTYGSGGVLSYRFECTANEVIVTETGVTKLIDLKSGQPIGDGAQAVMPAGAAVMALFTGKGDPEFLPAEAAKNAAGGWDLTIRLPKDDKRLKAVGKSDAMSLFTTGYTVAIQMDAAARAKWNDFLQRCKAAR